MLDDRGRIAHLVRSRLAALVTCALLTTTLGLSPPASRAYGQESAIQQDPNRLMIVDCLLPGQVRKLGGQMTYLSQRRAVRSTAVDCEIRGGEYVAYDRASYDSSLAVWMPQAEGGDALAQVYVGEMYEKGLGREPDYREAARWYGKAAQQGFARGQLNLAYLYEQGLGVEKDPVKALNFYRQGTGISDDSLILASELTEVRGEMQRTIDDLTAQLEARNTEVDRLQSELDVSQSQLSGQRAALARAQGEVDDLERQVAQARSQGVADPARVAELQQLERDLQAREMRLAQEEQATARLEASGASLRAQLADQMREAAERDLELRTELGQVAQERDALQRKLIETQRQLLETEKQSAKATEQLALDRAQLAASRQALAKPAVAADAAAEQERRRLTAELAAREKSVAQQQAQIAKLLEQQRNYTAELSRLRAEVAAQGSGQSQAAAARSELATTQERLARTEKEVATLKAQLDSERAKAASERTALARQSSASTAEGQKAQQKMASELAAREQRIAEQQARIASLEQQKREYDAELARLRASQQGQLASTRSELASLQRRLAETQQRVADLTAQLDAERRSIAAERAQIERRAVSASSAQQVEIDRLRKSLAGREAEVGKQQELIAALQAESKAYQQQVQRLQSLPVERVVMRGTAPTGGIPASNVPKELRGKNYYALVIGNNRYENLPHLETAVADAQAVVDVLESRYGFRARPLLNATKGQMLTALNDYRKLLTEDDSLLIYYAGHGTIDRDLLRGYWQPVDASRDDDSTWIDGDEISKQIEGMKARHVLVVADSCYSGALTRGGGVELKRGTSAAAEIKRLTLLSRMPSRTVLTSGGEQPVLDAGGGGHSIFATAFLQVLRTNGQVLDGSAVYNQLFDQVRRTAAKYKVDQSPRYTALREAGHLEGEFLFIPVT
jgi:hypothetical protein